MAKYSIFSLLRNALSHHENWQRAWREPEPKPAYDVIIVGGGGHGLATAYYLAKEHGITNVAVVEKGWLGGGNTGRNTTVVRSNYLWDESAHLYEHSLKLWERLSAELNYNVMFSPRGLLTLAHSPAEVRQHARWMNAIRLNDIDSEWLGIDRVKAMVPILDCSPNARFPVLGATYQGRAGVARHDAVAWGFARAADALGVDIIQNCETTGFRIEKGRVSGVETTRGTIAAGKVGIAVAGHSGVLAGLAGFRLPINSRALQAMVSEPVKPVLHHAIVSAAAHVYISQSDRGELVLGSGMDGYNSYSQRGGIHVLEEALAAAIRLYPVFSRLRLMRSWGGIVDTCPDASPIIGKTPVDGLFIDCGWGTGGFKATPGAGWVFAHTIARDAPHELNAAFGLERFKEGRLIDEVAASGISH